MLLSLLVFTSCSEDSESAIAKAITFTVSKTAIVAPNDFTYPEGSICPVDSVSGPRVRLRSTIKWTGQNLDLVPLTISLRIQSNRLQNSNFSQVLAPKDTNESLANVWDNISTDFIQPGDTTYESRCLLDYSSLPKPTAPVLGNAQLKIPAQIVLTGVVRNSDGEDTPFTKTVSTEIIYVDGSVPPD